MISDKELITNMTAEEKFAAFERAGIAYTRSPAELDSTMWQVLKDQGLLK